MEKNKKFAHRYKVSKDLQEYLEMIFLVTKEHRRWETDEDGNLFVCVDVNSDPFHRLVMRARCEKKEEENGGNAVYVTRDEYENRAFVDALRRLKHKGAVCILGDNGDVESLPETI